MTETRPLLHGATTQRVIGACYEVYNELGWGYAEIVYANALEIVLRERGVPYARESELRVHFRGCTVGDFRADFIVEALVMVELKARSRLQPSHEAQLINYLRGSGLEVGLLFNFGEKPELRRLIWTPSRQQLRSE